MYNNDKYDFIDIVSILSFIIGLKNLQLNIEQNNQLDKHLKDQDEQFIAKIINQNEEIIKLLKELKK